MIRQPIRVPRTVPSPPLRLPPPMTTAAMTWSSRPLGGGRVADRTEVGELKNARQTRRQAAERVDDDLDRGHVDPAEPRGRLVRADRVDVPAQQAVAQRRAPPGRSDPAGPRPGRHQQPARLRLDLHDPAEPPGLDVARDIDRRARRQPGGQPAIDLIGPQRDDERHDPQAGDQGPVDRPAQLRPPRPPAAAPPAGRASSPGATPAGCGSTFFTKSAMQTVTSATVEPTERSIPPAIMMIVMPRAAVPTITVWTAIVRQLSSGEERARTRG